MEIRAYQTYNEGEILSLYNSVGWTAYTAHPEVLCIRDLTIPC